MRTAIHYGSSDRQTNFLANSVIGCIFLRRAVPSNVQVQYEKNQDSDKNKKPDLREVAKTALLQILEPLASFVSDSGFSTSEFQSIFREAAVRNAAAQQLEASNRINISGIAATTGIPRAEISRILNSKSEGIEKISDCYRQSTNSVLAGWHADPKFTYPSGQPADLKLYGRGATFEALAKRYGRGIPVRAVLDELVRASAIELLPTQNIRVKASMTVERGISARVIKAFGDRASELLATMLLNMKKPDAPRFIGNVSSTSVVSGSLPLVRKELSVKGANFLADVQESFSQKPNIRLSKRDSREAARVSVTIFYYESLDSKNAKSSVINRRRNFRRNI